MKVIWWLKGPNSTSGMLCVDLKWTVLPKLKVSAPAMGRLWTVTGMLGEAGRGAQWVWWGFRNLEFRPCTCFSSLSLSSLKPTKRGCLLLTSCLGGTQLLLTKKPTTSVICLHLWLTTGPSWNWDRALDKGVITYISLKDVNNTG